MRLDVRVLGRARVHGAAGGARHGRVQLVLVVPHRQLVVLGRGHQRLFVCCVCVLCDVFVRVLRVEEALIHVCFTARIDTNVLAVTAATAAAAKGAVPNNHNNRIGSHYQQPPLSMKLSVMYSCTLAGCTTEVHVSHHPHLQHPRHVHVWTQPAGEHVQCGVAQVVVGRHTV